MIISFSLLFWQYPLLMSIALFWQIYFVIPFEIDLNSFAFPILNSLVHLLAIIPELILQRRLKQSKDHQEELRFIQINTKYQTIKLNTNKKKHLKIILCIIVGILNFISNLMFMKCAYLQSYGVSNVQTFIGIILNSILSYLFFYKKLYSHQILSLALIAISIVAYYWAFSDNFNFYVNFIYSSLSIFLGNQLIWGITSSIQEVMEHYLMIKLFMSSYMLLCIEGIVSLLMCFIYFGLVQCLPLPIEEGTFFTLFSSAKWEMIVNDFTILFASDTNIGYIIGFLIFGMLISIFRILTNQKLSPTHRYMAEILFGLYFFISDTIQYYIPEKGDIIFIISRFVYTFVIVIASFIYNEYIIIHLCGLDKNTFVEIDRRSQVETGYTMQSEMEVFDNNKVIELCENDDNNNYD